QLGGDLGEALDVSFRPAIFDRDRAPLDPPKLAQSLHEGGNPLTEGRRRAHAKETDSRQLARLLRARRERPRGRAAEQRDERAPSHSITSSARASSVGGTSMPSARAVGRLMTKSNLVGCTTGRSAGLAPLRILPV